jgi:hypothetical protein
MEVSGQLLVPAASPLRKEPPVSIGWEVLWAQDTLWTRWYILTNFAEPNSYVMEAYRDRGGKATHIIDVGTDLR